MFNNLVIENAVFSIYQVISSATSLLWLRCVMWYSLCMKFQANLVNFHDQLENRVLCKTFSSRHTRKFNQA